ncbi:methyl-CpG-binding domain-containing protein 13-like isoform X2 [Benincasa hispida]|uniref:methyl-CpG-binding domain-containing protein 13-like isoform X2 n=1 Tax=Benincasa hispida TaxID=102211 RepID=UPI0019007C61|nr:methyl-CpG-binding domain-containing protein 13-like isoform X2 [Benincasa hispida]
MVSKGSPDWLPSGWTVQYKVQKTGRKIRFYTNLETGKSFYYKDDVIGYIKSTQSQKSQPTLRRIKTQSGNSPVQVTVKTNEHPEWLPAGWKVESRTRMSGSNVGAVYKVVIEHYKDEDLPPGWIKEIKIKEKADGIRKDPFYIDPKSGYIFRSKKDVFRYLETGEISKHAFKPREGGDDDQELISDKKSRPSTVRGQKLEHSAATPQPLAGEAMPTGRRSKPPGVHIQQLKRNMFSELKDGVFPPVETVEVIISSQEVVRESTEIEEKSYGSSASPKADHLEGNETVRVSSDNVPVSISASESDQEKALPKAEKLESNKIDTLVTPDNSPLSITTSKPEREKIAIGNTMESVENGEKTKTRKFKKKKDINLPRRSSKRLAGIEPELVPKEEAKEVPQASNGSSFTEVSPDAGLTVKADADVHNADEASQQLDVRSEKDNKDHVPNLKDTPLHENPSNKRKTPPACGLDVPEEKIQRVETEKEDDRKMEAQLNVPIADFWSDPCLEFAIKTLTGALPVENATTTDEPVSTPTVDFLQGQSSVKTGPGSCMNKRTQGNKRFKNKKEPTSNRQSSSINGLKPDLASNIISFEQANPNNHSNEAVLAFNLADGRIHGQPQSKNEQNRTSCQILPSSELLHPPPEVNSERFNRTNAYHESSKMMLDDPHQMFQTKDHTTSEAPLSFPFGDSWADPCLDFAFKTLTGAIPIDDSLEIQSFFEERLESSRSQKDSSPALPDFGSLNLFQNDISSHFDGPEKSVSAQHLSLDPQLTLGNVSQPSYSGFTSQQQSSVDRNRSFRGR